MNALTDLACEASSTIDSLERRRSLDAHLRREQIVEPSTATHYCNGPRSPGLDRIPPLLTLTTHAHTNASLKKAKKKPILELYERG